MKREGNDMNKIVKTFAQANGLTVSGNTAYGSLRGYTAAVTHGKEHIVTCVSMGNPHCVVFADQVSMLPLEKIGEILAAYREKKKYYRLGDGSFLTLDEKNVGLFAELEKNFDLDEEKLAKKEMTFLAYRGMYLNTLLSKFPDVEVSGNKSFKLLTGNRENSDCETPLESILREYQKKHNSRAVKKTLSIPEWLNEEAIAAGINFSQVLQEALIQKIKLSSNL